MHFGSKFLKEQERIFRLHIIFLIRYVITEMTILLTKRDMHMMSLLVKTAKYY